VSPEKEYTLQAENELEQREWVEAIQVGTQLGRGQKLLVMQ
jgi:hypothetical protein